MLWEVISLSIQSFGFLLSKSLQSLLSHFSHVRLCATPQTAAHQAPPSLGFSRQERWRGLPFPSPIHESILIFGKSNTVKFKNKIKLKKKKKKEKWKWNRSVMSDPQRPHCSLPGSSVHGIFQARVLEWGAIAFSVQSLVQSLVRVKNQPNQPTNQEKTKQADYPELNHKWKSFLPRASWARP